MRRLFVVADYECARDVIEDITGAGLKITQPNTSTRSVQSAEKALNSWMVKLLATAARDENQPPRGVPQ
jgi:hypothetical protein